MNDIIAWLLDTVQGVDPLVRTLVATVAIMLETSVLVGLVVPGDMIVTVAGTAVSSWQEGIVLGVAVVAGSIAGESIGFVLGRCLDPRIRASRVGQRIGEADWIAQNATWSGAADRRSSCPDSFPSCTRSFRSPSA